jgi:hypothetical protein
MSSMSRRTAIRRPLSRRGAVYPLYLPPSRRRCRAVVAAVRSPPTSPLLSCRGVFAPSRRLRRCGDDAGATERRRATAANLFPLCRPRSTNTMPSCGRYRADISTSRRHRHRTGCRRYRTNTAPTLRRARRHRAVAGVLLIPPPR